MNDENIARVDQATPMPPRSNLALAFLAGLIAAVIGGVLWAVVTVSTNYQIGFMAIGVGFLVGYAVRFGRGNTAIFGYVGAVLALFGCVLGNFFSLVGYVAQNQHVSVLTALSTIDYAKVPAIMMESFQAMDLLFYGIAVYEGYRFSLVRAQPVSPVAPATS